ncbi:MAG: methylmalonyl Co-A mutase-associated GTPase MeaB [Thermomicrobiales bacterium]
MVAASEVLDRLHSGDPRLLPRLATLIENEDPRGLEALDALYPLTGNAHIVGLTGPPGAGKSTLIAALVDQIRASDRRVAVLAVDPSSPLTGGAVLGDRIRMMARHADPGVYMRSMASRGRQGGLAWATAELVHLLDAAGYPLILVETIGTGQDGTDIASLADTILVVEAPGLGDGVQAIKSGLLEVGDVVVVNKADQPGAREAVRLLRSSLALGHAADGRTTPVLATDAITGTGVPELLAALEDHSAWLDSTGHRSLKREQGARAEVLAGLRATLDRRLGTGHDQTPALTDAISRVARRELTPRRAVEEIVAPLLRNHTKSG